MVEKVNLEEREQVDAVTKTILKQESTRYINYYYRAEGTFVFSLISLLLTIFLWDSIRDPLFFMLFSVILNFLLMGLFMFKHLKQKGVF